MSKTSRTIIDEPFNRIAIKMCPTEEEYIELCNTPKGQLTAFQLYQIWLTGMLGMDPEHPDDKLPTIHFGEEDNLTQELLREEFIKTIRKVVWSYFENQYTVCSPVKGTRRYSRSLYSPLGWSEAIVDLGTVACGFRMKNASIGAFLGSCAVDVDYHVKSIEIEGGYVTISVELTFTVSNQTSIDSYRRNIFGSSPFHAVREANQIKSKIIQPLNIYCGLTVP